jgi:hypothetical protein
MFKIRQRFKNFVKYRDILNCMVCLIIESEVWKFFLITKMLGIALNQLLFMTEQCVNRVICTYRIICNLG